MSHGARFATTRWSLILAAGGDRHDPAARAAVAETVAGPDEIDAEIAELLSALEGGV